MTKKFNPFHLVNLSPWPIVASIGALSLVTSGLLFITKTRNYIAILTTVTLTTIALSWWRDIHRESTNQGNHSDLVINGLKTGIIIFILSEVLFFTSFFWAFFHRRISPTVELGQVWPPNNIQPFNPMRIPLLNTVLLLSSGVTVTWAHHEILKKQFKPRTHALTITIILGVAFSILQGLEYWEAPFRISDTTFGSRFFMATGFHGLHVILGSIFLAISLKRFKKLNNTREHLIGFECAAWYWHFVDVVWLFLYSAIYWWGA